MSQTDGSLRLLRRTECGLCQEMAHNLLKLGVSFQEVDIEQDAALERAFGDHIPVLLWDDSEIARAPQSERSLRDALIRAGLLAKVP